MKSVFAASLLVLVLSAPAAQAQTSATRQAADQFGLLGSWAHIDCSKPPSSDNDYDVWTMEAGGALLETDDGGADYKSHYRFEQARTTGDDMITIEGVSLADGDRMRLVLVKRGDQQRTFESQDVTTGKLLIAKAAFVGSGGETAWYTKCK